MREGVRRAAKFYGSRSLTTYPADRLHEEAAFLAYYLHWSHGEIMELPHRDRIRWCAEVSRIHSKLNDEPENVFTKFIPGGRK